MEVVDGWREEVGGGADSTVRPYEGSWYCGIVAVVFPVSVPKEYVSFLPFGGDSMPDMLVAPRVREDPHGFVPVGRGRVWYVVVNKALICSSR